MILYCEKCQKPRQYFPSNIKRLKNKLCRNCYFTTQKMEGHPNWKGDEVGYKGLHDWIHRNFGKAYKCITCDVKNAKRYEWANLSHTYKRDILDWAQMCTSCHHKYDKIHKTKEDSPLWKPKPRCLVCGMATRTQKSKYCPNHLWGKSKGQVYG